jgi:formylglycine-generating enzyme required for sulfatase activity
VETFERVGLALPTEAQWEYGCRAGTSSVYWCGDEQERLRGVANLMDAFGKAHGNDGWTVWEPWLDDGETVHGEVGQYRANPFGLHDVHGNVLEWTSDPLCVYGSPVRAGDGARMGNGEHRVLRGGSYGSLANVSRSAAREDVTPQDAGANLGVRPARRLAP